MFSVTTNDIDLILRDYGISGKCDAFSELQRYHYEKDDPNSKEVRLIVKVETDCGKAVVIRFKNEADITLDIVTAQSRFAVRLADYGIETPRIYASEEQYARWYQIGGYEVIVTVEDFVTGELQKVDAETAEKTGKLLAKMHNVAEEADLHVENEVLFDPLADFGNDLFDFKAFAKHKDFLCSIDKTLYEAVEREHANLVQKLRAFEKEPKYAVQGDISDCNLFITGDGIIGVFDFNRSGDNVLYFDAIMQAIFEARLMDYPAELAEDPEPVILPAFLKGYNNVRPFTTEQREAFPYFYALVSAFWLSDMRWDEHSLANAVKKADSDSALQWMKEIYNRITYLPSMPL